MLNISRDPARRAVQIARNHAIDPWPGVFFEAATEVPGYASVVGYWLSLLQEPGYLVARHLAAGYWVDVGITLAVSALDERGAHGSTVVPTGAPDNGAHLVGEGWLEAPQNGSFYYRRCAEGGGGLAVWWKGMERGEGGEVRSVGGDGADSPLLAPVF